MQTGKYQSSHPLLSWSAQGWGGEWLVHSRRAWEWVQWAWEVGRWPEQAEPGGSLEGSEEPGPSGPAPV